MPALFLAFVLLPLAELYLLIRIGKVIGPTSTLALVIVTGFVGAALAKRQGRKVLGEWREALAAGRVPEEGVLGGILVLAGGLLLVTPGVISDVLGLVCLLPYTRRTLAAVLQRHLAARVARGEVSVRTYGFGRPSHPPSHRPGPRPPPDLRAPLRRGDVIDTEGEEV